MLSQFSMPLFFLFPLSISSPSPGLLHSLLARIKITFEIKFILILYHNKNRPLCELFSTHKCSKGKEGPYTESCNFSFGIFLDGCNMNTVSFLLFRWLNQVFKAIEVGAVLVHVVVNVLHLVALPIWYARPRKTLSFPILSFFFNKYYFLFIIFENWTKNFISEKYS